MAWRESSLTRQPQAMHKERRGCGQGRGAHPKQPLSPGTPKPQQSSITHGWVGLCLTAGQWDSPGCIRAGSLPAHSHGRGCGRNKTGRL